MSYENLTDTELRELMRAKPFDKIAVYEAASRFLTNVACFNNIYPYHREVNLTDTLADEQRGE